MATGHKKEAQMKTGAGFLLAAVLSLTAAASFAAETSRIRVDVPVTLTRADVVFNQDHPAFASDMPVGIKYMKLMNKRLKESGMKGRIVGVFHGQAAYMTLNDRAYNANRHVSTGNPYKELIGELLKQESKSSEPGFAYGTSPNEFLASVVDRIPKGRVLSLAEGEGRNAVFLASKGYEVVAVDSSASASPRRDNWQRSTESGSKPW
jgi:hypothetical protein